MPLVLYAPMLLVYASELEGGAMLTSVTSERPTGYARDEGLGEAATGLNAERSDRHGLSMGTNPAARAGAARIRNRGAGRGGMNGGRS